MSYMRIADVKTHFFSQKQKEFIFDDHRFALLSGGVGSGKSMAGCYKAILFSLTYPKSVGLIGNQTYGQLSDSTMRTFSEVIEHLENQYRSMKLIKSFDKSKLNMTLINGSEILFRAFDKEEKVRGTDLNYFYLDEASTIREDIYMQLMKRLRKGKLQQAWLTTNPDTITHWIYKKYIENPDPPEDYKVIYVTSYDNKENLPPNYIKDFNYLDEDHKRRWILGQWGIIEGLVYKQFDQAIHVKDIPLNDRWRSFYRGIDYGFTNPFVCLFIAIDGDDNCYVFDEYYKNQVMLEDNVSNVLSLHADKRYITTYVDPSSPETINKFKMMGQRVLGSDNEVDVGIQSVMRKLHVKDNGEPSLYIHPNCKNLIRELLSYKRDPDKKTGIDKEKPIKKDDHCPDALRYVIHSLFTMKGKIRLRKDLRVFY